MIANRHNLVPKTPITQSTRLRVTFNQRVTTWLACMLLWTSVGCMLGAALDVTLWHVSLNYVYSPQMCLRSFIPWTLTCAVVIAAAATTGSRPPARMKPMLFAAILGLSATIFISAAWAGTAAWLTVPDAASIHLAPLRRVRFCDGLYSGAEFGFAITILAAIVFAWRQRHQRKGSD